MQHIWFHREYVIKRGQCTHDCFIDQHSIKCDLISFPADLFLPLVIFGCDFLISVDEPENDHDQNQTYCDTNGQPCCSV